MYIIAEKYRPKSIDEMIISDKLKTLIKEQYIKKGGIPHLGIFGLQPGTGKSSLANALVNELDVDNLVVNASLNNGIDVLRDKITTFVTNASILDNSKVVTLSEADGISNEFSRALRDFMDMYVNDIRFIFTANYEKSIIEAIRSRLTIIDMDNEMQVNKKELAVKMYNRLKQICELENIKYQEEDLKKLIKTYYPSFREVLLTLQRFTINGEFRITDELNNETCLRLVELLKAGDYKEARSWITGISNHTGVYYYLYENLANIWQEGDIPKAVITIQHYFHMNHTTRDSEITLSACIASLMERKLRYV